MDSVGLNKNTFNKWRCLIALAFIDGKLQPTEREFIKEQVKKIKGQRITKEQMNVFLEDFREPKKPNEFFREITDDIERIDLLRLAYNLFWADGDFDLREERAYEAMKKIVASDLNVERYVLDDIAKKYDKGINIQSFLEELTKQISE